MPWIFVCLMIANAVYFGWKFMEGTQPQARPVVAEAHLAGANIQLLSERPEPKTPEVSPEPSSEEEQALTSVVGSGPQCFSVGPFAGDPALQKFVGFMRGKGFSARVDKRKVDGKDYWVFVPAFTNRDKAEDKLKDLKSRGIEGFVVKEGVFINAISLNHFSRKELAQAFLQKMQAAGVSVEYREISQAGVERWVFLSPARSKDSLRAAVDAQLDKQEVLKRENAPCEE
ncbi:MAG: SPOR domain-containing protein [Moraxellaceae bacterium]